ncbi:YbcC family protein [Marinobacterium litorale]|uniref:YbcC family protein n=1 Tax=Marinobacterium litorale TaxID=404770 RepID=UPI0003F910C7|nr:DUF2309 domain-containing protein [Marinobacterium litorale]
MTSLAAQTQLSEQYARLSDAVESACAAIAPNWPLDRMIAVNPYWGMVDKPFETVNRELGALGGSSLFMPLDYYRQQWEQGEITEADLQAALDLQGSSLTVSSLVTSLERRFPAPTPAPLLSDVLDAGRDLHHEPAWCDTITHQVSQFCGAWFDEHQADWRPDKAGGLYANWHAGMQFGHSVELLMQAPWIGNRVEALPQEPWALIQNALDQLGLPESEWQSFLHTVLLRISGWASWCAYRRWQARLAGEEDQTLIELLAIRLAWECLLDDGGRDQLSLLWRWHGQWDKHLQNQDDNATEVFSLWQRAMEHAYQRDMASRLTRADSAPVTGADVQAVFCIDVRSEVFRRHLETTGNIETLGFAGFFGLPISYTPLGTQTARPQLPGLLAPAMNVSESSGDAAVDEQAARARQKRLNARNAGKPFNTLPGSAFSLVETLGLGYLGKLIRRSQPRTQSALSEQSLLDGKTHAALRPQLIGVTLDERAELAARVLRGMNLTGRLARWVLLIGHGSQTDNNPHKAGLDCGACCGQSGEVNARALAVLLNDRDVRIKLNDLGVSIPEQTRFVAGFHNTTTEEVSLFTEDLPEPVGAELENVQQQLTGAGQGARRERAQALGLEKHADQPETLLKKVRQRANDWAQTRPEWGLGNNAAFIIAPRSRSRSVDLNGRSFLHEYDPQKDADGALLEQIMTAPMIVTNWINMQYYASTVDPRRFGSGNKTLHNVVGGRIGVFEGNGGDLRIGLAKQSLHNGKAWQHQPLRLTVVIDAPRERIQAVIDKHPMVAKLFSNGWLHLMRFGDQGVERLAGSRWQPL